MKNFINTFRGLISAVVMSMLVIMVMMSNASFADENCNELFYHTGKCTAYTQTAKDKCPDNKSTTCTYVIRPYNVFPIGCDGGSGSTAKNCQIAGAYVQNDGLWYFEVFYKPCALKANCEWVPETMTEAGYCITISIEELTATYYDEIDCWGGIFE